jgi:hypothetical protein
MGLEALLSSQIIGLSEAIDDRTASLLVAGTGITLTYNDGAGTLTIANTGLGGSTGSTDNRILRSDGTGGATVQASAVTIDDSGNISGLALITSTRAGSMGLTNPQNQIVVYGGYPGYGIGFDGNGELLTCVNSALGVRIGTDVGLRSTGALRFNSTTNLGGSWDVQVLRNATGPSAEIRAAGGLRVRVADGSHTGSKINVQQWDSPDVTTTYVRHDYNGMTFYGCTSPVSVLTCSNQGWKFQSDVSTKFRNQADTAGGAIECGAITASGVVSIPDGAVGSPGWRFASDTDTGMYRTLNNTINVACGGTLTQQFQSDGSLQLFGSDPWLYTGFWAIRQGGSGVINLRASNGTTPATVSLGTLNASALVNVGTYTVATLPSAASNAGALAQVTDSSVTANGSTVAGGGSSRVPVFSDGTNWIVK